MSTANSGNDRFDQVFVSIIAISIKFYRAFVAAFELVRGGSSFCICGIWYSISSPFEWDFSCKMHRTDAWTDIPIFAGIDIYVDRSN